LTAFVDTHPNPTPEVLEALADGSLDDSEKEAVDAWLAEYTDTESEETRVGGDPRGLLW
jgi:anti-sigma factor RsiW